MSKAVSFVLVAGSVSIITFGGILVTIFVQVQILH
jgi:hypothetical protein